MAHFLSFVLFLVASNLLSISKAGCPFASMMNSYNFSGDWSYNESNSGEAIVMHMCHFADGEIYLTVAKNDTPNDLIGFGAGNWSQTSMMVGGQIFTINNASTAPVAFGIGMNMEQHQWWFQDANGRSGAINQDNKEQTHECFVPYAVAQHKEYWLEFWDVKRKFHRQQRIAKRMRDRERKKKLKEKKKQPQYMKYYEQFLEFVGMSEEEEEVDDPKISEPFVYDKEPDFPNLYGESWITDGDDDDAVSVTFIDETHGCFNGQEMRNISATFYGLGINSFIETEDGMKNGQFFIKTDKDKVVGSSIIMKKNEEDEIARDEVTFFEMHQSEKLIPCGMTKVPIEVDVGNDNKEKVGCTNKEGQKCEL